MVRWGGHELECRRQRGKWYKEPEAGVSLFSCSFEHICLRKGGRSVWSVGNVGERKVRDEVGRGPEHIGPCSLRDVNAHALEQPQHYPQEVPGPAGKGSGKTSWAIG